MGSHKIWERPIVVPRAQKNRGLWEENAFLPPLGPPLELKAQCLDNMSSYSPTKSASSTPYKDVRVYVHSVSEVKIPANPNSSRYFHFTIQESDDETQVICFTAEKKDELKRREKGKAPTCVTKISPRKRRYGEEEEYKMNKCSRIEQAKNLAFQWQELNTERSEITVAQILQSAPNGQSVGLKAKVIFKGDCYVHD